MARRPRRNAVAVCVLSLALATNAVMLTVLGHLFFSAPPLIHDPGQLVRIVENDEVQSHSMIRERLSYPELERIRERGSGLESIAGSFRTSVSVGEGTGSFRTTAAFVTSSYFATLGVRPFIGRTFTAFEDEPPEGSPLVILSHSFWNSQFTQNRELLGQSIKVDGKPYTIIGVMPPGFRGTDDQSVDLWFPMSIGGSRLYGSAWDFNAGGFWIETIARLEPGATSAEIGREVNATPSRTGVGPARAMMIAAPFNRARGPNKPLEAQVAMWLAGVAVVVLMIACANVSNTLLVRSLERRSELAVRLALGGSRLRLGTSMALEAVILSIVAALGGLAIALFAAHAVVGPLLQTGGGDAPVLNARLLGLMVLLAGVCGTATSILPIVNLREARLEGALRAASATKDQRHQRVRFTLLAFQVALTVVLLCGAGLFLRSIRAISQLDMGFDPDRIVVVDLNPQGTRTASVVEQEYAAIQRDLETLQRVQGTAVAMTAPFLSGMAIRVQIPGRDSLPAELGGGLYINAVTPSFFDVLGMRLQRGRLFRRDEPSGEHTTVVSRAFADAIWPSEDPLGKCVHLFSLRSPCLEVTGVVDDPKRDRLGEDAVPQFFVSLRNAPPIGSSRLLFARVSGNPNEMVNPVVQAIQRALPNAPYPLVRPLERMISRQKRPWELGATLFSAFSVLALLIACLGLYNLVFHDVKARERELAIRVTLGATPSHVARSVVKGTGAATGVGLIAGLLGASWMGFLLEPMLFRTRGIDPALDVAIGIVIIMVALAAAAGPLRRALVLNPATILRDS